MIEWGQCGEIAAEDSNPAMRHAQVQLNARDILGGEGRGGYKKQEVAFILGKPTVEFPLETVY